MTKRILIFGVMLVLVSSIVIPSQQINALEVRTDFSNRHTTESFGNSKICGDHVCVRGEKPLWTHATWGFQRLDSGKIPVASHGEDIMSKLVYLHPVK